MPSDRRRRNSVSYLHPGGDDSSDDGHSRRKSRPRGYASKLQRGLSDSSIIRREGEAEEKDDDHWDTDYDPRDRYYLSAEDDPFDSPQTRRGRERESPSRHENSTNNQQSSRGGVPSRHEQSSKDWESSRKHRSSRHASPSRNGHAQSQSHGHSQRHSRPRPHSRDSNNNSTDRHKPSSQSKAEPPAARPRPRPTRASSSRLEAIRRPRAFRAGSSHIAPRTRTRPGPARGLSHHSRQTKPKSGHSGQTRWDGLQHINWEDAAKVALQAGTVAACKIGSEPIPWTAKGTKIASAALGAAMVDHVLQPKKRKGVKYSALRFLTELAVSNMVVGPAFGKVEEKRHTGTARR